MFKTFPEFSKLTLADKEEFESFTKDFPPIGDISFPTVMLWWNALGGLRIARLNDNLVISYWLPGDDVLSGLALVGTQKVDESICAIFDFQREKGEEPRLVNVPEFVVNSMRYPELFKFYTGRGDDEYVLTLSKFADLERIPLYMRTRVRRFTREEGESNLDVRSIDLSDPASRRLMLQGAREWPLKGVNDIAKLEREVLPQTITNGHSLGLRCVGLFMDGALQAYCIYYVSRDNRYAIIPHARVNYNVPRIFDYVVHAFSRHFVEQGVEFINIDADSGSLKLRALKLALKPDDFFRKYSIEPA